MMQRTDIQALRGLAILLVVFYHARLLPLEGGYLGVDIFFVISGFLITSLIARGVQSGTFSFRDFYYRRARRLLPAAYVTLAVSIALSPFLLTSIELHDFVMQVMGTVTFTGNIVLWKQTGYFEGAAELKPLLHVWSLAIEEQYYMLLPAALVFVPKRYWLPVVMAATVLSFGLYVAFGPSMRGATFYLFPTRAWELGIGSLLALATGNSAGAGRALRYLALPAGFALLLIPVFPLAAKSRPEISALLVCLATAVIIAGNYQRVNKHIATRALAKIGDFSYSLYLVHWPIFAFLNNANVGGGRLWSVQLGGLVVSFALAYLLYIQIEQRFRLTAPCRVAKPYVVGMVLISIMLVASAWAIERNSRSSADYAFRFRANVGFGMSCESTGDFRALPECRNVPDPTMVVWGDSFAMHLVAGIVSNSSAKVMQATRTTCAPLLGYAIYSPPRFEHEWAESCIRFNEDVLRTIAAMPSVKVVVLAGQWSYFLGGSVITKTNNQFVEQKGGIALASDHLRETVLALRNAGKRVVVIEPPPSQGFNIGRCIERNNEGKLSIGAPPDCRIVVTEYEERFADTFEFLRQVTEGELVKAFSFRPFLCGTTYCETRLGNQIIYKDTGHFSYEGSVALARKSDLFRELEKLAW